MSQPKGRKGIERERIPGWGDSLCKGPGVEKNLAHSRHWWKTNADGTWQAKKRKVWDDIEKERENLSCWVSNAWEPVWMTSCEFWVWRILSTRLKPCNSNWRKSLLLLCRGTDWNGRTRRCQAFAVLHVRKWQWLRLGYGDGDGDGDGQVQDIFENRTQTCWQAACEKEWRRNV